MIAKTKTAPLKMAIAMDDAIRVSDLNPSRLMCKSKQRSAKDNEYTYWYTIQVMIWMIHARKKMPLKMLAQFRRFVESPLSLVIISPAPSEVNCGKL